MLQMYINLLSTLIVDNDARVRLEERTTLANGVSWVGRPFREDYPGLWEEYKQRIAVPMDLRTARENLERGLYPKDASEALPPGFVAAVRMICESSNGLP